MRSCSASRPRAAGGASVLGVRAAIRRRGALSPVGRRRGTEADVPPCRDRCSLRGPVLEDPGPRRPSTRRCARAGAARLRPARSRACRPRSRTPPARRRTSKAAAEAQLRSRTQPTRRRSAKTRPQGPVPPPPAPRRQPARRQAPGTGSSRSSSASAGSAITAASIRQPAASSSSSASSGSDSTSLDEALELLLAAGWRIDAAVMALLPEALELRDEPVPGLAAWQAAAVARVEPWDGPAALVFADGRRVGCVLDRNGLRPAAFEVRRDGLVVCGSEAGMLAERAGRGHPARAPRPRRAAPRRHGRRPDPRGRGGEAGRDRRAPRPGPRRACWRRRRARPAGVAGRRRRVAGCRGPDADAPAPPAALRPRRRAAPHDRQDDGHDGAASPPGAWATTRRWR